MILAPRTAMHLLTSLTPGQSQSLCLQSMAVAKIEGAIWMSSRSANQGAFWRNKRLWARFRVFDRAMTTMEVLEHVYRYHCRD
jgi:hypothetical protein